MLRPELVDEQLLADDMNLQQGRLETAGPFPVALVESRVAEAVEVCVAILLPQQHQRPSGGNRAKPFGTHPTAQW